MATDSLHPAPPDSTEPTRRKRRWKRVLGLFLVLFATLVFVAPVIIAKTDLRQRILPMLLPQIQAEIEVGSASLSWFARVELRDVTFRDAEGNTIAKVGRVSSRKQLWQLAADPTDVGVFDVHGAELEAIVRADGSNVEDAFGPLFEPAPNPQPLGFAVHMNESRIHCVDAATGEELLLSDVNANVYQPLDLTEPLKLSLRTNLEHATVGPAGAMRADVEISTIEPNSKQPGTRYAVQSKLEDVHAIALAVPLRRLLPQLAMRGVIVGDMEAVYDDVAGASKLSTDGRLSATQFAIAAPSLFGKDKPNVKYLTYRGGVSWSGDQLQIDDLAFQCDAARVAGSGVFDVKELSEWSTATVSNTGGTDFELTGEFDLARTAAMLPETLSIRDDLTLQSGTVSCSLSGKTREGVRQWSGSVTSTPWEANANGQAIRWDRPLSCRFAATSAAAGFKLEELTCEADFISLSAGGDANSATLKASCDLERLMKEASQFVDLRDTTLRGYITATGTARRSALNRWALAVTANADDFEFGAPGRLTWREPKLVVSANAEISSNEGAPSFHGGQLMVSSGSDNLTVTQLPQQIASSGAPSQAFQLKLQGQLESWITRVQPWVELPGWQVQGRVDLTADVGLSGSQYSVSIRDADWENLAVTGNGVFLREPKSKMAARGTWDASTSRLSLPEFTWAGTVVSMRADDVTVAMAETGPPAMSGKAAFRGDAQRLASWVRDPSHIPEMDVQGTVSGTVDVRHTAGVTDAEFRVAAEKPVIYQTATRTTPAKLLWREENIDVQGGGKYDAERDAIDLRIVQLNSQLATMQVAGTLEQVSTIATADLKGTLACDMPRLSQLASPWLGPDVRFTGRESRPFAVKGPLVAAKPAHRVSPQLTASATIGWTGVNALGMAGGPADLRLNLDRGVLGVQQFQQAFEQGSLTLNGHLPLNSKALVAVIGDGTRVENVTLTPEITKRWMKYAAPALADSTQAQGRFSVRLADSRVPLSDPVGSDVSGVLAIQSAQVAPGPVAAQFLSVAQQVKQLGGRGNGAIIDPRRSLIEMRKQDVPFRLARRQVTHQGMTLAIGGVDVTTRGSVNLENDALNMVAAFPIPNSWVRGNKLLAGMKGKTLDVPVTGTLSRPTPDPRFVQNLFRGAAESAGQSLIEDQLQKGLGGFLEKLR